MIEQCLTLKNSIIHSVAGNGWGLEAERTKDF